tara:strand:- start:589 stop:1113 length:525 start_codon:yes stop_codon:yes gene_type:complete
MRFTDKEIAAYVIANAVRAIRDNDRRTYYFEFGTTDEEEHWMLLVMSKYSSPTASKPVGGSLYKDRNKMFHRINYYSDIDTFGQSIADTFRNQKHASTAFWTLVEEVLANNSVRIGEIARQARLHYYLDITDELEPSITLKPGSLFSVIDHYHNSIVHRSQDNVTLFRVINNKA